MTAALRFSSWMLDIPEKEMAFDGQRVQVRVRRCRTQLARREKGLSEFPCKQVRQGYLAAFAAAFDPAIQVRCVQCPPDDHHDDLWCVWEFSLAGEDPGA